MPSLATGNDRQPGDPFRRIRRFGRAEDGSTTIEFAVVVIPFLMVTLGTIEITLMFFTANAIEGAMDQATRMVRTGQLQDAADPAQAFRNALCDHTITVPCDDIRFEMVAGDTVAEVSAIEPFWADEENTGDGDVDLGATSSFVIARAAYDYTFLTPMIGMLVGADSSNQIAIQATAVVRNEPF
ncbi:MAG: pilus assembly protein [Alphaproteobacteria bacterium]|nr:pilus assembly protein [Alphaproteobacteria bacterium SS10]